LSPVPGSTAAPAVVIGALADEPLGRRARAHGATREGARAPETAETLALDVGLTSFGSPCDPAMTLRQLVRFRDRFRPDPAGSLS
jgi:hypothetical protein